jgi:hypothetical protein
MASQDPKQAIKERFRHSFDIVKAFSEAIEADVNLIKVLREQVLSKKRSNPDLKSSEVSEEIKKTHETTTMMGLKEQDIQRNISNMIMLYELAALTGTELDLTEEEKVNFEFINSNTKSLFAYDSITKELKIADAEMYKNIFETYIAKRMTEAGIEEAFNAPYFTVQK